MLASIRLTRIAAAGRPTCRAATRSLSQWACETRGNMQMQTRGYAKASGGRFQNTKKARTQVLEREAEPPSQQQQQNSLFSQQSQYQHHSQQQQFGAPPTSSLPGYVGSHEREREEEQGRQWEALTGDVVGHMRKVYATLAVGVGIAAGASMFTMATPLIGIHPMIPGLSLIHISEPTRPY